MVVLPFIQAEASAVIELIETILASTLTLLFGLLVFHSKLHAAKSGKKVWLTPNDFTHGLGHLNVVLLDRYISIRGILAVILAIALTVASSTVLLGTTTARCASHGDGYAGLTELRNTTCYVENREPGSANPLALMGTRLRELVAEEKLVNVDVHPKDFDFTQDAVTEFRGVTTNIQGEVLSAERCTHKVVYEEIDSAFSIRTDSDELNALESNETVTARPNSSSSAGFLGMTHDLGLREVVAVWAKEVTIGTETFLYVVYGYAAKGFNGALEDSRCVKVKHSVPGLQVLIVPDALLGIGDYDADPIRLVKVTWLAASLAQTIGRQGPCRRRNYTVRECTKVSRNTTWTIAGLAGLCVVGLVWVVIVELRIGKCQLRNVFSAYGLFAMAARSVNGRTMMTKKVGNRSGMVYEAGEEGGGELLWVGNVH